MEVINLNNLKKDHQYNLLLQWRGAKCNGDSLAITLDYSLPSFENNLRLPGIS